MRKKSLWGILAVVVVVAIVVGLYLFRRPQEVIIPPTAPFELSGTFAGPQNISLSADSLSLSRVIHGYFDRVADENTPSVFISAQINWPEEEPQRILAFNLLPQTEYLCWPSTFTTGDGTVAEIKDTIFLLDENTKLFVQGQKPLTYTEALNVMKSGAPLIIALQESYAETRPNTIFQVGIVGCQ